MAVGAAAPTGGEALTQPMRMLDGLQSRPAGRPASSGRRNAVVIAAALAVIAVALYGWWEQSGRGIESPGLVEASRQSREVEAPTATTAPPEVAVAVAASAISAPVIDASVGPASIERTAAADARPATAHPLASPPLTRELDPSATTSARPFPNAATPKAGGSTPPAARQPGTVPFVAPRVAAAPRTAPQPLPSVVAQAPPLSGDPDVTLFSALLARLSGDGTAAAPRPTIAQLVERCEAQSANDSIEAFECKRRLCAGYWGKADACPMALAPKRD